MMRPLLVIALVVAALPAAAEQRPSCTLLGQMAVSTWLEMLKSLRSAQPATIDPIIARLDQITSNYATLDCEIAPLSGAMDCLLSNNGAQVDARTLAQNCMSDAGLSAE